ncbi:helix-turn-helix domain-containing protein [Caballeronia sp. SEWSISQ10-4 2]|uniref:helix-turn-helix domain-containing protein n=1 Tax=Caballeronia sp. SEWSISQ10-4 2 TaxID=2937438 RepID=UPI00264CF6E9|nr:helix-turn-helix domain-containing protein [Caballeronia sp. SEWSISQ10-4 2]MDN7179008.1 helix-turn-helix domain-containing protein [Caballeronia sp. SEWSISQ10-4 2]
MTTNLSGIRSPSSEIVYQHFSTHNDATKNQMLAWQERTSHILDVPVTRAQIADGFRGTIDSYRADDLVFMYCRTDPLVQMRSVARISTDNVRDFVFHVAMEGSIETVTGLYPQNKAMQSVPGILALDMNQPMRMERPSCHVAAFFLPRAMVESILPGAESIHGRVVEYTSPLARMIPAQLATLCRSLHTMSPDEAHGALRTCAHLIVAAFGKETGLAGNVRAAARAAMFDTARRYIEANLHEPALSPQSVLGVSQLPRPTLYRLFEHEGGLATYIRNRRLREAADELLRFPNKAVVEIAYGLGFKSPADFNHAFRRAYDMPPRDFRARAL